MLKIQEAVDAVFSATRLQGYCESSLVNLCVAKA